MMTVHEIVLRKWGERVVSRLARRAIWKLQRTPLLEHDPHLAELGFKSLWDEVCWQVQKSHGPYWLLYEHEIDEVIRTGVEGLSLGEQQLLWLCTPEGEYWFDHEAEHYDSSWAAVNDMPSSDSDLVAWIHSATLTAAADWCNSRLRLANEMGWGA